MSKYDDYGQHYTDVREVRDYLKQIAVDLPDLKYAIDELLNRSWDFDSKTIATEAKEIRNLADAIDVFLHGADYLLV